jgi:hypothetical protein
MKALFEADPNDENGKAAEGCKVIWELEDIIKASNDRKRKGVGQ